MPSAKILIVEDNPADVYTLRRSLLDSGEEIGLDVLPDGACALQFVRSEGKHGGAELPCVIVLDLHLPKHDGLEVLRAIREDPELSHVHVLVLATCVSPSEEAELREMGANFRLKPSDLSEFLLLAADLIALCRLAASR